MKIVIRYALTTMPRPKSADESRPRGNWSGIHIHPIRIIISADGSVKDVHVIHATVEQRNGIERALGQWKFKPPAMDGRAAEIETGLLIEFRPGGVVRYSAG